MQPPTETLIALHDIAVSGTETVLDSLQLEVPEGSRFAVLGLPGSGKTTLVKVLGGLVSTIRGSGHILGHRLGDPRITTDARIGFLHQSVIWHGGLTVYEMLSLLMRQYSSQQSVVDLAALAGLTERLDSCVATLSPGERHCLGLAALHMKNPELMILDDPAVDVTDAERTRILDLLAQISADRTLVFTTSKLADAKRLATHVALLHQGTIQALGTTEEILSNPEATIFLVVLSGDASIVYESVRDLAWVKDIQVSGAGNTTRWTIALLEGEATPTSLLRAIMADRSLDILQFQQLRPRIDYLLADLENGDA